MTSIASSQLSKVYARPGDPASIAETVGHERAEQAFARVFAERWNSSGLPDENPFTSAVVARTAGILAHANVGEVTAHKQRVHEFSPGTAPNAGAKTLEEIIGDLARGIPESISVQKYPPHPAIAYWLVEAVDCLRVGLHAETWERVTKWAAKVFVFELSRVTSGHDALMDPVALAMAACLCRKIQRIASKVGFDHGEELLRALPSLQELEFGIKEFIKLQRPSGIWARFFPLFHYQQAANHCFTFEILEAIIDEFRHGTSLFDAGFVVDAFEKSLWWCEQNRLQYSTGGMVFRGWNSGGDRNALRDAKPEVWATGTVHIFAAKLQELLRDLIRTALLREYQAVPASGTKRWDEFIDVQVTLPPPYGQLGVKTILEKEIATPIRSGRKPKRRAALLFGPPGTSKTTLVRALASSIDWQFIEINPSHFLRRGLEQIYVSAEDVFRDLVDLRRVVILFDEMDALVQRRDESAHRLDVTQQFLTTSMLPHLAKLHEIDDVLFFMATNHQREFDQAIKRPGRFDLLLCIGPPRWTDKKENIERFSGSTDADDVRAILSSWVPENGELEAKLDVFTFDELKSLFEAVRTQTGNESGPFSEALKTLGIVEFKTLTDKWYNEHITLRPRRFGKRNSLVKEFRDDQQESNLQ